MTTQVLLVDDEREYVETLKSRLAIRGFDVDVVFNGNQAIEMIQKRPVDVIVLDVCMPEKGGLETLREIKKINPVIEVIMLTGHAELDTSISGLTLGADDYLIKPVQLDDLVTKIELAHQRKKLEQAKKQ